MEHSLGESFTVDVGHLTEADVVLGRDWLDTCSLNKVGQIRSGRATGPGSHGGTQ